jgi:hypothetical protein
MCACMPNHNVLHYWRYLHCNGMACVTSETVRIHAKTSHQNEWHCVCACGYPKPHISIACAYRSSTASFSDFHYIVALLIPGLSILNPTTGIALLDASAKNESSKGQNWQPQNEFLILKCSDIKERWRWWPILVFVLHIFFFSAHSRS